MAYINFVIPTNKQELLRENDNYYVKNVVVSKELIAQLKNARGALKDEGAEFIIDAFDVYYSVLHHADTLTMDVIFRAYEDLHKAAIELNRSIGFILEDKESLNDELKMKFLTILKMLLYLYTQIILMIEQKNETKNQGLLKGSKKSLKNNEQFTVDKKSTLILLNNIMQRDINLFWDPPIVEENFVNIISEVCYRFLQDPCIKRDKETLVELFNLIGSLIKGYSHGTIFVIRMVQLIKMHEHLVHCLPEGVQQLVANFGCKGLVHDLIREVTEWQTEEKYQDSQGARYCATLLSSMAVLMPDLMIPELMYLNKYLAHESATLRNSVLSVITEVVINVLTNHALTDEQKECRDEFLAILMDHMEDVSALVRAKVMQHWARLHKENAIPLKCQSQVLQGVIDALQDKGAMVRKGAAICLTTFLTHNTYGSNLPLSSMAKELEEKQKLLNVVNEQFEGLKMKRLLELEEVWSSKCDDIKAVVDEELKKDKENRNQSHVENTNENENGEIPKEHVSEMIRIYLNEDKYKEAFQLCKMCTDQVEEFRQCSDNNEAHQTDLYLTILHTMFLNVDKIREELNTRHTSSDMSEEDFQKMEALRTAVDFLKNCVTFLQLIDSAIDTMAQLLETTAISDMHEAIEFFISAYQFNIENASRGILAMLRIMQRNEQERKECIINAFKKIYLETDANNMGEHCITIVNRLVELIKTVPVNNYDDLQQIISEWTSKGILDNSVIDMLWQYFTQRCSVTEEDSRAGLELLKMCALGRKTVITKNLKLVATVGFGERGENDMRLLGAACEFMAVAGMERIDITSKEPPFKIKPEDEMFQKLLEILATKFLKPVEYYNKAMFGAMDFIYKLCSKPEKLSEILLNKILNRLRDDCNGEYNEVNKYVLMRLCQLLGYVALKQLEYLDETVYRELKRRNYVREERKRSNNTKKQKKRKSRVSALSTAVNESALNSSTVDESVLEGAQAEDTDAEFILNVLENDTVTGAGGLGKMAYLIIEVCERPNVYDDAMLQGAAVIALIRYMLVSSKFCEQNIQLLFTIFEKTDYPEVRCSILVHLSDLLTRFPNIIEPWTPRIYQTLKDPLNSIRSTTFFTLANLILRDMIRAHSHISQMALCLVDQDIDLRNMCKTFFLNLSHKENNLYNVLPDIFSHLMDSESLSQEEIHEIMKYLFELVDKTKKTENLVDRFCCKFQLTEDVRQHRSIAYCLSLIQYNEKSLRKLIENFPTYKHLVHDEEIYGSLKSVMQACNKQQPGKADLKPIVAQLETSINSMFELNEDNGVKRPSVKSKSARKTKKGKKVSKKRDEESDDESSD